MLNHFFKITSIRKSIINRCISFIFIIYLASSFILSEEYVLLVSFDGFRYDYADIVNTPNFDKIEKNGVKAASLKPIFPTLTFPNHYSIATGCYADNHRIISNSFYSKTLDRVYSMYNRESVLDSAFYGGEPIWLTAEKNKLKTASYFWVGSEAIGKTPSIYKSYDSGVPFTARIDSVISWFNLPEIDRPHLALLYFNEPDHTGHMFGPESVEIRDMVLQSDFILGYLLDQVNNLDIKDNLNIIIVSDHGMSTVTQDKLIFLDDFLSKDMIQCQGGGAICMINQKKKENFTFKNIFKKKRYSLSEIDKRINFIEFMDVYEKEKIPSKYHFLNQDSPDFLLVADNGWFITDRKNSSKIGKTLNGMHGYDPQYPETHGIFYATGPSFRKGYSMKSFENIHVYPIICEILGIPEHKNIDGDIEKVRMMLR
tara:strand:- start:273 stop:1553 length:1281 start_codon:yes stop_codon:yes gene_type:complete